MTKDEAMAEIQMYSKVQDSWDNLQEGALELIHDIYDDFESRTCFNCTYYDEGYCRTISHQSFIDTVSLRVSASFGCNKWQQKD
ncbi:MAG: hypothetical protein DRP57_10380 [Spirochaetes bacterium]|nr:MAG: hypothetical protein DRP57_10380 [Spirochaetota bacterium]